MARTAEAHQDQDDGGQMEQQGPRRPSPSPSSGSSPVPPADDGGDDAIRVLPDVEHGGGVGGATSPSGTDTSSAGDVDTMVYVVTGANCGIGFEVAKRLARREREQRKLPAPRKDIVLACKDLTAAHEAVKRLAKFCPDDNTILHPMQVELGNHASTASFGLDMKRKFAKVDCVVCNAGVLVPVPKVVVVPQANKRAAAGTSGTSGIAATTAAAEDDHGDEVAEDRRLIQAPEDHRRPQGVGGGPIGGGEAGAAAPDTVDDVFENEGLEPERNTDGLETNVGTNHVGHVFLISVLMPLLMNAPAGRVVVVSSSLLKKAKLRTEMLQASFKEMSAPAKVAAMDPKAYYAESKLLNALFVRALRRQLDRRNIDSISVYCATPGWCQTQLHRYSSKSSSTSMASCCLLPCLSMLARCFMRSARKGSETVHYVATEDPSKLRNGCFYKNLAVDETVETFLDKWGDAVLDEVFAKSQEATKRDFFP